MRRMTGTIHVLAYRVEGRFYGLPLSRVERVLSAVEVAPLLGAPQGILGVINVAGDIVPVVGMREILGLAGRSIGLGDRLIIARLGARRVALLADSVEGVLERNEEELVHAGGILDGARHLEGVLKLQDGLLLIYDLEAFLSLVPTEALHEPAACQ